MKRALLSLASALMVVTVSRSVDAQVTRAREPAIAAPLAGTAPVRWPAVAYDTAQNIYLAVSGAGAVQGQYFSPDGAALGGPFAVSEAGTYGQAPRVTYGIAGGAFLVTWHETVGGSGTRIRGRLVRYGRPPLTGSLDVSPIGTNWEMGAASAYSPTSDEFLVSWQNFSATSIAAQRVSGSGAMLGAPIAIDTTGRYQRDPTVVLHPGTNTFFVVYAGCAADNDCFLEARRVQAGTGALIGAATPLDTARADYIPEAAHNDATGQILVVWYRRAGAASLHSRLLDGAGTASAASTLVTDVNGSYDANALAYNRISNTFLVVTHSTTYEDVAIELTAAGAPRTTDAVTFGVATGGNFNPRVAASSSRAEWLAVTSGAFGNLTAQRFTTATRDAPPTDAGALAMDAAVVPDAAAPSDTPVIADIAPRVDAASDAHARTDGAGDTRVDAARDGSTGRGSPSSPGCGCRLADDRGSHDTARALALIGLGIALRSRRRPRSPLH